jgi:hypothetical protein
LVMRVLLAMLAVVVTGCYQTLASFRLSDDVTMDVTRMAADETMFDVRVEFKESSAEYRYLIQEGDVGGGNFLVECWKTDSSDGEIWGYDHHWQQFLDSDGFTALTRRFTVYVGKVEGEDLEEKTRFAMLPRNMDGTVVTNINPALFNADYFARHRLQGRIVERAQVSGTWRLTWEPGMVRIDVGHHYVVFKDGATFSFVIEDGRGRK